MKLFREPLFHFLLLGAAIFAAFSLRARHRTDKPGEILVTQGTAENIVIGFTRTWQRPPTKEELQGLIRDYIREEAAYREALAMGLDRDDTIVRRRLRQKLEFLPENLAAQTEPSDADLERFLQSHLEIYKTEPTFSFRQVYLNPQLHGANLQLDEIRLLAKLRQSRPESESSSLGDPFLLESKFTNISLTEVKKAFGDQFASGLIRLQPGQWQGPVQSGYGAHLVFVNERVDAHLPVLTEVHDQVRREWLNARRREATDNFYEVLLKRYTVRIESPEDNKSAQVQQ